MIKKTTILIIFTLLSCVVCLTGKNVLAENIDVIINLQAENIESESATITWETIDERECILYYRDKYNHVEYPESDGMRGWHNTSSEEQKYHSYTIPNVHLEPGTIYEYQVSANTFINGENRNSEIKEFTTVEISNSECSDSDNGKNYYIKGEASIAVDGYTTGQIDKCYNNYIREAYCDDNGNYATIDYECPNKCNDGACIEVNTDIQINNINVKKHDEKTIIISWISNSDYTMNNMCNVVIGDDDSLLADKVKLLNSKPSNIESGLYKYEIWTEISNIYYKIECHIGSDKKESAVYYYAKNNDSNNVDSSDTDNNSDDNDNNDNSNGNDTNQLVLQLQRQITELERQVIELEKKLTELDQKFAEKFAGTMFLDVENHGRLWYVDPSSKNRFYFENGKAALSIGSKLATGITYEDIQKIPVGIPNKLYNLTDSDGDGLPDRLESALGSDPNNNDSDGDGFNDKQELENEYNPVIDQKYNYDQSLVERLEGKMLLQVSGPNSHGEIWYIKDGQRWYGGTEDSMYEIMKARSLGATPENIRKIAVGEVKGIE